MKALSLTQPYATLIAAGFKLNETRSRGTSHRGPLLIHASATRARWAREACRQPVIASILKQLGLTYETLPRGLILCRAELVEVALITEHHAGIGSPTLDPAELSATELACGNYTRGRYAWLLADVQRLPVPLPAKGRLSLWDAGPVVRAYEMSPAAERARYRYLPADELMSAAGYSHYATGAYSHRPPDATVLLWPLHRVSFFSESGTCVLQRVRAEHSVGETLAAEVVASDEQLVLLLHRYQFPPLIAAPEGTGRGP